MPNPIFIKKKYSGDVSIYFLGTLNSFKVILVYITTFVNHFCLKVNNFN